MASAKGLKTCLDQFSKQQLLALYAETYGGGGARGDGDPDGSCKKIKLTDVSNALHTHIWALKEPLEKVDKKGRSFSIPKWTLDGSEVCKEAWRQARGGSERRHRDLVALVMRGYGPTERSAGKLAKLEMAMLARRTQTENSRRQWTENWWATQLLMHEWLPNEQAVRFRGQGYVFIHLARLFA